MPYEQDETMQNLSDLFAMLAKSSKPESDGGKKITVSEMIDILAKIGVEVVQDVTD